MAMLLTKLHMPHIGNSIVHRTELFEKLNEGLSRKLILISAPAGFGKSSLMSDWIEQQKIPTAWFSIDNNDNDIVEFLNYVISSIQSLNPEFGRNALELLKSPNLPSPLSVINLLINEIVDIKKDFLLVFDDFHLINNIEINNLVSHFIEHIPSNIHLAILSRSDLNLPIARLRSQHQLVELRARDLSFSAMEISVLFNKKIKLGLSNNDINLLESKTEGWIAGLQLAALSLQGRDDISQFIEFLKGDNRYIMDYLMEEVLKNQNDEIKYFLLKTSILEQFSAPLCNYILDRTDCQLIIERLERENLFVFPLDADRQWYRYHHLFADLLKQRLLLEDKSTVDNLHHKACDWFERNGMHELAIAHALDTNNFEKTIQLLSGIVEDMWRNGLHSAIVKYGDLLPDELIKKYPEFCLYYSWILITSGQIQKAEPFLLSAESVTKEIIEDKNSNNNDVKINKKLLGKIAVASAYSFSHQEYSPKIFEYCETAMENLSDDDPFWYSWAWFSYGIAYFSNADLHKSRVAFDNALEYGKKSGNIYLISTIAIRLVENEQQLGHYKSAYKKCSDLLEFLDKKGYSQITKAEWTYAALYFVMGITEYMWADTGKAVDNIKTAYELSKNGKDIYLKIYVLMIYSVILIERGDSEAEKAKKELENILNNTVPPFLIGYYIGWKSYLYMEKNEFDKANQVFIENGITLDNEKTYANESAYSSYVRLLIAQHKFNEVETLITELYQLAESGKRIEKMIDLKVSFSILYNAKADREKAIKNLMEAMELASEENLLIGFVYSINHIKDLLKEVYIIQATTKTNIPNQFIEKLKIAIGRKENQKKVQSKTDLSTRELDILKLITQDLTNQEIADKLFISLNTVKTHLKNIYLKLNTDSRTKAVAKAKKIGLI
jgi:LuxR family maltose regulon positive regulatory protein